MYHNMVNAYNEFQSFKNKKPIRIIRTCIKIWFWVYMLETICPEEMIALRNSMKEGFNAFFHYIGGKLWEGFIERGTKTDEPLPGNKSFYEWRDNFLKKGYKSDEPLPGNKALYDWIEEHKKPLFKVTPKGIQQLVPDNEVDNTIQELLRRGKK